MDIWEKIDKTTILSKEAFYSKLHLEDTTDKEYAHVKKVWQVFEIKNRDEYHSV